MQVDHQEPPAEHVPPLDLLLSGGDGLTKLLEKGRQEVDILVERAQRGMAELMAFGVTVRDKFKSVTDFGAFYTVRSMATFMDRECADRVLQRFIGRAVADIEHLNSRDHKARIKEIGKLIRKRIMSWSAETIGQIFVELLDGCRQRAPARANFT